VNSLGFDGLLFGGSELLVNQLIAVGATILFSGIMSFILAKIIDAVIGLRITPDQEDEGMDQSLHAEAAYALGGRI
ncbi:MAG TPA: hypothetical protein VM030_03855, partial [Acidimicrobiales bacterium]|nr:hypothetical protein [Acidimicrobiales bacterium]